MHVNKELHLATFGYEQSSTVLAQDHFFSDFLSLHLTSKTHKLAMMMSEGAASKISLSATCGSSDDTTEAALV